MKTRICIVTSIFHGFGKQGGFGVMARTLAKSLVGEGFEVVVAVPRRRGQSPRIEMEGYVVLGLGRAEMLRPATYQGIGADLYHSQSPNLMTVAAMVGEPSKKHVITCRDPRDVRDWVVELKDATWKRRLRNLPLALFEAGPLISYAVRKADAVGYAAEHLKAKIERMYRPKMEPVLLPNIESMPAHLPTKADRPKVCFIGRLDRRKRPELFIQLARQFPEVGFVMVGRAEDEAWQHRLEAMAKPCDNLTILGYIDKFVDERRFYESFEDAWIFVNTASREAFPLAFFEAGGRGCAILSHVDPDGTASRFGYWAKRDDFAQGLRWLLEQDRWKSKGHQAYEFFRTMYDQRAAIERHVTLYQRLLAT